MAAALLALLASQLLWSGSAVRFAWLSGWHRPDVPRYPRSDVARRAGGDVVDTQAVDVTVDDAPVSNAGQMALDEDDVFKQPLQDLALDVRELLITDANLFFVGPDTEVFRSAMTEVADLINFTFAEFMYSDLRTATLVVDSLEHVYTVPPLVGVQRWSWPIMRHGLVIWLDPDGYTKLDVAERERIAKLRKPKKKENFGPQRPPDLLRTELSPPGDPVDMWQEADVHVDATRQDVPLPNNILGSIIDAILANPPKWRGWMKQAKFKGTVDADFETPLEVRRSFYSHGMSPRLNRLLNA